MCNFKAGEHILSNRPLFLFFLITIVKRLFICTLNTKTQQDHSRLRPLVTCGSENTAVCLSNETSTKQNADGEKKIKDLHKVTRVSGTVSRRDAFKNTAVHFQ